MRYFLRNSIKDEPLEEFCCAKGSYLFHDVDELKEFSDEVEIFALYED